MELLQICIACGKAKTLNDYYKHPQMANGHVGKCKDCCKLNTHINYRKNLKYYAKYDHQRQQEKKRKLKKLEYQRRRRALQPEIYKANMAVSNAIRDGRLKKQPCEKCGSKRVQAHHDDYSKPLKVKWFCYACHLYHHGKNKR